MWKTIPALATAAGLLAASPGADGVGDPYYPQDGNGGYRVGHYDVRLDYDPAKPDHLAGDARISAVATQNLSSFDLDLIGFTVSSVTVNGHAAAFTRTGEHELVITPSAAIPCGATMDVRVVYAGTPGFWWFTTDDNGSAQALAEPHSATSWYPVNDTPSDKATFTLTTTVPDGWNVIGNGEPLPPVSHDGRTSYVWRESHPIASYLTAVVINKFQLETSHLSDGKPVYSAFLPGSDNSRASAARLPEVIDFLSSKFGPYPFSSAGGIYLTGDGGGGFEVQERPFYPNGVTPQYFTDLVHENAHQWFGDSVSVTDWRDICVKECFATYAEWLWREVKDGEDLDATYRKTLAEHKNDPAFWQEPLYNPGADSFYGGSYTVGPLMLHALRRTVGDPAFFHTLRDFLAQHRYGNATFADFEKLAAQESKMDLQGFFLAWAHSSTVPADKYLYVVKGKA